MIVIIQGPPAAGKTTAALELRRRLELPLISRDVLSERLLDSLGTGDERWTAQLGDASYALMFALAGELAIGAGGFIVESTLNPTGAARRMSAALSGSRHSVVELFLYAPPDVLVERYRTRASSATRHPGHLDHRRCERLREHLAACHYQPMGLGGPLLEVDTQRPAADVIDEILRFVATHR